MLRFLVYSVLICEHTISFLLFSLNVQIVERGFDFLDAFCFDMCVYFCYFTAINGLNVRLFCKYMRDALPIILDFKVLIYTKISNTVQR